MTPTSKASSARAMPAHVQALRLLALETAGNAPAWKRRLIAAAAPVVDVLFQRHLVQDIQAPDWPDRDRFIVSPHLRPLARALQHLLGQEAGTADTAQRGAAPAKIEEMAEDGVSTTDATTTAGTGASAASSDGHGNDRAASSVVSPARQAGTQTGMDVPFRQPGHGLAVAVGMALATRLLRERFGAEVFDHATFVLIDDHDVEPGTAQEAIAIAPWLRPHRLCVLHMTARQEEQTARDGHLRCPNHLARFAAAGWHVQQVAADDARGIGQALEQAMQQDVVSEEERRPAYIALEYDAQAEVPSSEFLREQLGWSEAGSGEVPGEVRDDWRLAGLRGRKARRGWQQRLEQLEPAQREELEQVLAQPLPEPFRQHMRALRMALAETAQPRNLQSLLPALLERSQAFLPPPEMLVLTALHDALPRSAALPAMESDAQSSSEDKTSQPPAQKLQAASEATGNAAGLDLGLRPMALAAVLAGLAAHGGARPVGVVRRQQLPPMLPLLQEMASAGLAASIFVLDDDGCRHAPVEVAVTGVTCLCPADAVELVECWQLCMQQPQGPALLILPSGELPAVRTSPEKSNLSALGGYELFSSEVFPGPEGAPGMVLHAAGRSLAAALKAAQALDAEDIAVRVFSIPAPHWLLRQDAEHRARVLETGEVPRLFVPPGELRHAWTPLTRSAEVLNPCDDAGRLLSDEALAARIEAAVRARLGRLRGVVDIGSSDEDAVTPDEEEEA